MSPHRIAWQDGDERVWREVDTWHSEKVSTDSVCLHENPRRSLYRLDLPDDLALDEKGMVSSRSLLVKIHHTHSGSHPRRESIKHFAGASPALREWRALCELHAAGASVPVPAAWGRLADGDAMVVTEYRNGEDLAVVVARADEATRAHWWRSIARAIRKIHAEGFRHGDLHLGNLYASDGEVVVLDLQRARRRIGEHERLRDLAQLDFSLARAGFSSIDRTRLRNAILPGPRIDEASRRFVHDHLRGRARRVLRIGRQWESVRTKEATGLRDTKLDPARLAGLIASDSVSSSGSGPETTETRREGRTRISTHTQPGGAVIVKRVTAESSQRAIADGVRGSAAMRAFRRGQKLAILGELSARPLAALERRRGGVPVESWLILESVGEMDLDRFRARDEAHGIRFARSLARWIAELHAWGIDHLDLKASNIRVDDSGETPRFWLIDLEDIRFRRRMRDATRRRALIQLNASLGDDAMSLAARRAALTAYLERLPFKGVDDATVAPEIARASVDRAHRWRGKKCRYIHEQRPAHGSEDRRGS